MVEIAEAPLVFDIDREKPLVVTFEMLDSDGQPRELLLEGAKQLVGRAAKSAFGPFGSIAAKGAENFVQWLDRKLRDSEVMAWDTALLAAVETQLRNLLGST